MLQSNLAEQLCCKNVAVPDLCFFYSISLVYFQLWFRNKKPKPKTKEAVSDSEKERKKPKRLYIQRGAVYESLHNFEIASNLPVSKVGHFFPSKIFKKFTLTTRNFKRKKAPAQFRIEIYCMNMACNDKLAQKNNAAKYLADPQNLVDSTVDAKRMKAKVFKGMVGAFLDMRIKRNRPNQLGQQKIRLCWRVWKTLPNWTSTNLIYNEGNQGWT